MAIGIDELDFNEEGQDFQEPSPTVLNFGSDNNFVKPWLGEQNPVDLNNPPAEPAPVLENDQPKDVIELLLQSKGISNPDEIKFLGDDGNIFNRAWKDLSPEEQLEILRTPEDNNDLDADEVSLINLLRQNGITPQEYQLMLMQYGAQDYASQLGPQEPVYQVDDISDDELFLIDLQTRSNGMSEEELLDALDAAKKNEVSYKKLIDGIREEYRKLEELNFEQELAIALQQQEEEFEDFSNSIYETVSNMESVGNLDLELDDDDREEIAEFILGRDSAGNSYLGLALNDPETLVRMAWFALRGNDALDEIVNYYNLQITEVRKESYQNGYNDAQKGSVSRVVVGQKKPNQPSFSSQFVQPNVRTVDDLD